MKQTVFTRFHEELGAKMVPFAGFLMPVEYQGINAEHIQVRTSAGVFDVSHMGEIWVKGPNALPFIQYVTSNDASLLQDGKVQYTCFPNGRGGIVDDLLVYRVDVQTYLLVVNAANNDKDWAWINAVLEGKVQIDAARPWARALGTETVHVRDMRAAAQGDEARVQLALQGPRSRDVLLALQQLGSPVSRVTGADVSGAMLRYGQQKIAAAGRADSSTLVQADAAVLCFPNDTFDAVTVAFGVRNYSELERGLREMQRVLRPGGRTIILEFSMPETPVFRASYLFYFRHILPRIAGIISRQYDAYHYLNRSVEAFPYGQAFCDLLQAAGFENITARPLTFGIAMLYVADKPA